MNIINNFSKNIINNFFNLKDNLNNLSIKERVFGAGSWLFMIHGSVIAHEYSHMTAMRVLFSNINVYMSCDWVNFNCYADSGGIPILKKGLSITYKTGYGIVSAVGPIADIINIAISSIVAWKMRQSNKKISQLFATHAFIYALSLFSYSLESLGSKDERYDFVSVQENLGIPCIIQTAMTGLVALGTTMLMKHVLFSKPPEKEVI